MYNGTPLLQPNPTVQSVIKQNNNHFIVTRQLHEHLIFADSTALRRKVLLPRHLYWVLPNPMGIKRTEPSTPHDLLSFPEGLF